MMKSQTSLQVAILVFVIVNWPGFAVAQTTANSQSPSTRASADQPSPKELRDEVSRIRDGLDEVRRDQLNYQIEKDLLKETYSSNVQTINVLIAIVFGAVTLIVSILGFAGIRSVGALRKEFDSELREFRRTRVVIEDKIAKLIADASGASERVEKLSEQNTKQDRRLAMLELLEKAASLMTQKRAREALRYLEIVLTDNPNDEFALDRKATCHNKLFEFDQAQETYRKLLAIEPPLSAASIASHACNLAENLALTGTEEEYQNVIKDYGASYSGARPLLPLFFDAARASRRNDIASLRTTIGDILKRSKGAAKPLGSWSFDEARQCAVKVGVNESTKLFWKFLDYLDGKIELPVLQKELEPKAAAKGSG